MNNSSTISLPKPLSPAEAKIVWRIADKREGFTSFIFRDKVNRTFLGVALVGAIIQFIVFKFLYPFPDFFSDSYSYIYAAYAHLDVSIWPIGYSKFLAAFHGLTHSDTALVGFQYFFMEFAALYFFFTWVYFFRPGKSAKIALFAFLFFNPLFLYISNYVNSDPLFAALSIFWFTELIWIVNRPRLYQVFTQGVLLFMAFTVRNNAYIYPFIGVVAFLLSRQRGWVKLAGCLLGPALILPFVLHTRAVAKEMTGTAQFSLFTGWQLANNALYAYPYMSIDSNALPTPAVRELNGIARQFYDHTPPYFPLVLAHYDANFFIREPKAPLKQYSNTHYHPANEYTAVIDWGKASAIFDHFGSYLLWYHPWIYLRYFMLPNSKNYLIPPLEKLRVYNLGDDKISGIATRWFDLDSNNVTSVSKNVQAMILFLFPGIFLLCNLACIGALGWILVRRQIRMLRRDLLYDLVLTGSFLLLNAGFCVFSTIIVLRYEFFPMIIGFASALMLLEFIDESERRLQFRPKG